MCGICGIYNYEDISQSVDEALLVTMSNTMEHRGPDDAGTYLSPDRRVGFGFRRLSIVDLSPAAHQPMRSADGSAVIVFNGEIYNHLVLRKEFEGKGHRYRSRSDTESILCAYQEYGLEFIHKLLGMFALAIWDEKAQRLVLARDRIGIKPLYYTFVGGSIVFGSEIKAILKHPAVSAELNDEALDAYLTFLITPAPMTMFRNIHKLEPGHLMVVGRDGEIRKQQYWDPVPVGEQPSIDIDGTPVTHSPLLLDVAPRTEESCASTIRALLKQSIKDRMMSDVPFGVFLSGGIDSSTNVALMAELMNRPVDTFSVGFRDLDEYNELEFARQVAREFGTNHHEIIIDHRLAFDFLPKLVYHQDEPLADPVCIPLYFVSKLARENGTIVVQVGEGSDEQFSGYSWYLRELRFHRLWRMMQSVPSTFRRAIYSAAAAVMEPRKQFLPLDYIRKACTGEELFWGGAISFTETHKRHLLNGGIPGDRSPARMIRIGRGELLHDRVDRWHEEILRRDPASDYLKRMIYVEFKNRLPELLLMRVDKVSMATSVEARVPFLDHRLVEYSMTIPTSLKIRNGVPKYILKKAVEGIIPPNIIHRKKQGFAAPMDEWLRRQWYAFAERKLLASSLTRDRFFNQSYIRNLLFRHREGKRRTGLHIWTLLNLVLWYEHWIEGKSFDS